MNDANNTNINTAEVAVFNIHPGSIVVYMAALFVVAFRNVAVTTRPVFANGVSTIETRHRVEFTLENVATGETRKVKYLPEGIMKVAKLVGGVEVTDATLDAMYPGTN